MLRLRVHGYVLACSLVLATCSICPSAFAEKAVSEEVPSPKQPATERDKGGANTRLAPTPRASADALRQQQVREDALDQQLVTGALAGDVLGLGSSLLFGLGVNAGTDLLPGALAFGLSSFITVPLGAGFGTRIAGRGQKVHPNQAVGRAFRYTLIFGGSGAVVTTLLGTAAGDPEFALIGGMIVAGVINAIVAPIAAIRGFRGKRAPRAEPPSSSEPFRNVTFTFLPTTSPQSLGGKLVGRF